jgi:CheY-specific phosphatase CheX
LEEIAIGTLERVAFAFAVPDPHLDRGSALGPAVTVAFRGPTRGAVALSVSPPLLRELTRTMLCSDADPTPEEEADALGELCNVICGNAVGRLSDPSAVYLLDRPRPVEPGGPPIAAAACSRLRTDAGAMEVSLYLEDEA